MSKMSELDLCINELRNVAQTLTAAVDSLAALFSGEQLVAASFMQNGNGNVQMLSVETVSIDKPPEVKPVTLEQVRGVLADKSQAGFAAEVRALLIKHGADKLSQIDPANYAALLKEAEELK